MTGSTLTERDAQTLPVSPDDVLTTMPPQAGRLSTYTLPGRHTLEDTLAGLRGFLASRIEATAAGRLNPY